VAIKGVNLRNKRQRILDNLNSIFFWDVPRSFALTAEETRFSYILCLHTRTIGIITEENNRNDPLGQSKASSDHSGRKNILQHLPMWR
jgi:hypothetical protein